MMEEKWKIYALLIVMNMVCAVSAAAEPEEFDLPAVNESGEETLCCSGVIIQIGGDEGNQEYADISGNRVVWINDGDDGDEIWMYNILTLSETLLFKSPDPKWQLKIDGDYVIWNTHTENPDSKALYAYYIPTGAVFPVIRLDPEYTITDPYIDGSRIVWTDNRHRVGPHMGIYMYDFVTGAQTQLSTDYGSVSCPVISGDKVVWEIPLPESRIKILDLTTGVEEYLCPPLLELQSGSGISGDYVVWTEGEFCGVEVTCDVRLYDLSTGTSSWICNRSGKECTMSIDGDKVVYEDMGSIGSPGSKLYLYDISTGEEELIYDTNSTATYTRIKNAAVDDGRVVWYQASRVGDEFDYDVFLYLPFFPF